MRGASFLSRDRQAAEARYLEEPPERIDPGHEAEELQLETASGTDREAGIAEERARNS